MSEARTIWLASYPRSGNTWMRALITALTRPESAGPPGEDPVLDLETLGHGPLASERLVLERRLGFASSDLTAQEAARLRPLADAALDAELQRIRFRKIHDGLATGPAGAPIVPVQATRGAVYVARDPRDVAVSYAHHMARTVREAVEKLGRTGATDGSATSLQAQFPQVLGTWSQHVEGWLDHDLFPVLLVRYEDLHADAAREVRRVAAFADIDAGDAAVGRAVQAASFARLQAREAERGFNERPHREQPFFRRGRSGAWSEELAPDLARRVAVDHARVMARLGYATGLEAPAGPP